MERTEGQHRRQERPERRESRHGSVDNHNPAMVAIIRRAIESRGRITFAGFMRIALYDPEHGYYRSPARRPGRGGDFVTAPELHPFFGLSLARQIAECWDRLGQPERFTVREYGAGIGGLAYDMIVGLLDRRPEIRSALRYQLIEVNPHLVARALEAMRDVGFGEIVTAVDPDLGSPEPITGVAIANEVVDALPVHRLQWNGTGFDELWVTLDPAGRFTESAGDLSPAVRRLDLEAYLERQGIHPATWPNGARIEVSPASERWIAALAQGIERGYAFIIDYGYPAPELYRDHRLEGTLRGHHEHTVTDDPLIRVGLQDLTAHVDFARLIETGRETGMTLAGLTTQADFLARIGLGDLLVDLQRQPDLRLDEYYRAQAAVYRLIDPVGLGRFRVLGLERDVRNPAPLTGFAEPDLPSALMFEQ